MPSKFGNVFHKIGNTMQNKNEVLERLHKELLEWNKSTIPVNSPLQSTVKLLIEAKSLIESQAEALETMESIDRENDKLRKEIGILADGLKYYADGDNWELQEGETEIRAYQDCGLIANIVLDKDLRPNLTQDGK